MAVVTTLFILHTCSCIQYCFPAALTKDVLETLAKDRERRHKYFKVFTMVLWYLLFEEDTQVNGCVYLYDFTGYTMQHFTAFSSSDVKDMMKWQVRVLWWQVRADVAGAC